MNNESAIAIIPARGGSKRIPRKNIKPFCGIPLIARTIGLLHECGLFARIVVSTDDSEIESIARNAGAEVPFRRPAELSGDQVATAPVVEHAIRALSDGGVATQHICCVYPAAVLALAADLRESYLMLRETSVDYVFTATAFAYPIQRALRLSPEGGVEMFWPERASTRSQELEPAYHDAGQFYWGRRDAWLRQMPIFGANSRMFVLPHYRVQDIDNAEDWIRAEMIYRLAEGTSNAGGSS